MNATRKILHLLCMCFVFVSCVAMADIINKPEIVKVNDISMYQNVADKILEATKEMEDITVTKATEMSIGGSKLMDAISNIYTKVISTNYGGSQETVHVIDNTMLIVDGKPVIVHVYINKKEKLISSLDIEIKK